MNPTVETTGNDTPPEVLAQRKEAADRLIRQYVVGASGAGFIYSPLINALAVAAMEVNMITDMAHIYDFPVPHKLIVYKVLISLAFSIAPVYFSTQAFALASGFTLVGYAAQVLLMGSTGGVSVYAVGKVFQEHYESGGTFLSSNNSILRKYFKDRFAEGKKVVPGYFSPESA